MNPFPLILPAGAKILQRIGHKFVKRSPQILIGVTCIGAVTSVVLAVMQTPKAMEIIEDKKPEGPLETIKECGYVFLPAGFMLILTCAAAIGSNRISAARISDFATMYMISEKAFNDYRQKTIERIGPKKEEMVRSDTMKAKIDENPPEESSIIVTNKGSVLCYDVHHDRYFYSDYETLRKAENDFLYSLRSEMWKSVAEFYGLIPLKLTPSDYEQGWDVDQGMEVQLATCLSEDNRPCISMTFRPSPSPDKYKSW